ncbi:MAG TPA: hypothetical protein VF251_04405, partial [Pyrinomonadaceae bacterium]
VTKSELQRSVDAALQQRPHENGSLFKPFIDASPIQSVDFFVRENSRRVVMSCEDASIVVETSLDAGEVMVMQNQKNPNDAQNDLASVASDERDFVRETLAAELGRNPTEEELNEWLREHTESY